MPDKQILSQKPLNQTKPTVEKLIILGSGPAGFSAAIYAARAELKPVLITGIDLGGQAALTNTIENYPGFPDGVGGYQLGELLKKQSEKFGAKVVLDSVLEVKLKQKPFLIRTGGEQCYPKVSLLPQVQVLITSMCQAKKNWLEKVYLIAPPVTDGFLREKTLLLWAAEIVHSKKHYSLRGLHPT